MKEGASAAVSWPACTYLSMQLCHCLSVCLSVCLPAWLSARRLAYLCICSWMRAGLHMSVHLALSVCVSVCLSVLAYVHLPVCLCIHSLAAIVDVHSSVPGATVSDEEDMAWGEQARIAIEQEANLSQGRWANLKVDPRSVTGSKHMQCLPDKEGSGFLRRRPCDRTAFLGRTLHLHSRQKGVHGCKAVPSHHGCQVSVDDSQEAASMVSLDNASQKCRSNNSSNRSSSNSSSSNSSSSNSSSSNSSGGVSGMRMNASKGSRGAEMHRRRQQQQGCQLQDGSSQADHRLQGSHSRSRHQWQRSQQHSMHGSRQHSSKAHSTHSSWGHSVHSSWQGSRPRCSASDSSMRSMQSVRHRCQESVYSCNCRGERLASDGDCQHASQMPVHMSQQHATRSQCMHHCNWPPKTSKSATRGDLARGYGHASDGAGFLHTQVVPAFGNSRLAERGHVRRAGFAWHMRHATAMNQMHSKTMSVRQGVHAARLTRALPPLSGLAYC